jgi:hypothetical protein
VATIRKCLRVASTSSGTIGSLDHIHRDLLSRAPATYWSFDSRFLPRYTWSLAVKISRLRYVSRTAGLTDLGTWFSSVTDKIKSVTRQGLHFGGDWDRAAPSLGNRSRRCSTPASLQSWPALNQGESGYLRNCVLQSRDRGSGDLAVHCHKRFTHRHPPLLLSGVEWGGARNAVVVRVVRRLRIQIRQPTTKIKSPVSTEPFYLPRI